jgi:hypothetical protein
MLILGGLRKKPTLEKSASASAQWLPLLGCGCFSNGSDEAI